jgi:hypothetical protein
LTEYERFAPATGAAHDKVKPMASEGTRPDDRPGFVMTVLYMTIFVYGIATMQSAQEKEHARGRLLVRR